MVEYAISYNLINGELYTRLGTEFGSDFVSDSEGKHHIQEVVRGNICFENDKRLLILNMEDFLARNILPNFTLITKIVKTISSKLNIEIDDVTNIFGHSLICKINE